MNDPTLTYPFPFSTGGAPTLAPLSPIYPPERGSLTFLRDGTFVLGCPKGTWAEARAEAIEAVKRYLSGEHGGIVLPWPCDVDDQRP